MTCTVCGKTMDPGSRFCSSCGATMVSEPMAPVQARMVRPRQGRMIAGVCAGIAARTRWEVALVRSVTVLLIFFGCGSALIAYLILWIVMPNAPYELPPYTPMTATPPPAAPYTPPYTPPSTPSGETGTTAS